MDVAGLVTHYGYVAVALGTFFEGEAALLIASFAAWRGHLELPAVITAAVVATFLGDFLHYYAGRRYGPALLRKYPSLHTRAERVNRLMHRHHLPLILSMRFLYGLRSAGLIALGMSGVPMHRFIVLNLASVIVWAIGIAGAGYFFGSATERLITDMNTYQPWLIGTLLLLLSLTGMLLRRRRMQMNESLRRR